MVYKCFMMYDYSREYFFLLVKHNLPTNHQWIQCRMSLEKKLQEVKKKPPSEFILECELGLFRTKYDPKEKCYFILLSNPKVKEESQIELLEKMLTFMSRFKQYTKLKQEEYETKYRTQIESIFNEVQSNYIQQYGNIPDLINKDRTTKIKQLRPDLKQLIYKKSKSEILIQQIKEELNDNGQGQLQAEQIVEYTDCIYRAFLLFDTMRQAFFLFIRRGFKLCEQWIQIRQKLEKDLLEKLKDKNLNQYLDIDTKCELGIFKIRYEKSTKCFFILLVKKEYVEQGEDLLQTIFLCISTVSKYNKISKQELDEKKKQEIAALIDNKEETWRASREKLIVKHTISDTVGQINQNQFT